MNRNILIVLTSHAALGNTDSKTGFWLEEFATPYYVFIDNGFSVTVASPAGGRPPVDPTSTEPEWQSAATRRLADDPAAQAALDNTRPLTDIDAAEFAAIFFPGGHGPMWDLATDPANAALVSGFYNAGKPVGAICHGPAALAQAVDNNASPIVNGKRVTGFSNSEETAVGLNSVVPFLLEDKLKALGGEYQRGTDWEAFVAVDGSLVTGQNPASSEAAARALLQLLTNAA